MTHDNNPGATMRTKRETLITTLEEAQRATDIAAAHLSPPEHRRPHKPSWAAGAPRSRPH